MFYAEIKCQYTSNYICEKKEERKGKDLSEYKLQGFFVIPTLSCCPTPLPSIKQVWKLLPLHPVVIMALQLHWIIKLKDNCNQIHVASIFTKYYIQYDHKKCGKLPSENSSSLKCEHSSNSSSLSSSQSTLLFLPPCFLLFMSNSLACRQ